MPDRPFECSLVDCKLKTYNPNHADPRKRWIIGLELKSDPNDPDSTVTVVNFCPGHAREHLNIDEDFFVKLERTEKFIREHGTIPTSKAELDKG